MSVATEPALVLASTSRWRAGLLERLGVPFMQRAPQVDEEAWKARIADPAELARALALAKAQAAAGAGAREVVLGGDQVLALGEERLDKPGTMEAARAQLRKLSGRTHVLWTSIALWLPWEERALEATVPFRMTMRTLDDEAIEAVLQRDRPLDCAGSYRLEATGIALFEAVEGEDATAVTGLPLMVLSRMLREAGIEVLRRRP